MKREENNGYEDIEQKIKDALTDDDADRVPESLLPENIGDKLQSKKVIKFPVRRLVPIAAALVLVVAAFAVLPSLAPAKAEYDGYMLASSQNASVTGARCENLTGYEAVDAAVSRITQSAATEMRAYDSGTKAIGDLEVTEAVPNAPMTPTPETAPQSPAESSAASAEDSSLNSSDFSTTNIQVKGVDEADIIKTDGEYIYTVTHAYSGKRPALHIASANGGQLVNLWDYTNKNWTISDIFLADNRLAVMMSYYDGYYYTDGETEPTYTNGAATRIEIYDLTDKSNPTLLRAFEQEGNYISSRLVGDKLLLISNKYVYSCYNYDEKGNPLPMEASELVPLVFDTVVSDKAQPVPSDCCYVMPYTESAGFTTVSVVNIRDTDSKAQTISVMGPSSTVYANTENVYIASGRWNYESIEQSGTSEVVYSKVMPLYSGEDFTDIARISYTDKLELTATGTVKGSLCSQFAMDEFEGNLRVAANHSRYDNNGSTQENNFYVLDSQMNIIGSLQGLAPGESMYSVRFEGKTVYAVTYRQIDPFFVIDLSDPTNPRVTGELKIPGFSQYLQTYDENLVIGFGMDSIESTDGSIALTQGFKVAMFDVSDPTNPVELYTMYIGDRGSHSELSYQHKALLFDKDKNIIAFPVTVTKKAEDAGMYDYGKTVFCGYMVLGYSADSGFWVKGRVTHVSDEDGLSNYYYYQDGILRGIYIGDVLYTLSDRILMASSLSDFTELSRIEYSQRVAPDMPDVFTPEIVFPSSEASVVY